MPSREEKETAMDRDSSRVKAASAALVDLKGRIWTEDPETAKNPASMPVWLHEGLRMEYVRSEGWALKDEHRKFASGKQAILEAIRVLDPEIKNALKRERVEAPKVTQDPDDYACGMCWHKVNIHNPLQGCPVTECICMATAGEASREHNDFTPIPLGTDQIRPGYRRQEQPMASTKGSHNGSNPYQDTAGRVWTFSEASGTWSTKVRFPSDQGGTFPPVPIRMTRSRTVDGWTLEGVAPDPIETGIVSVSEAIEAVRTQIDVATLTPETAASLEEPKKVPPSKGIVTDVLRAMGIETAEDIEPTGVWIVLDQYGVHTPYATEIDALRAVNEGENLKAWFVQFGKTIADVRGW